MPKHDDARLPAHAIAEINEATGKRRAELVGFWEGWANVGDAKTAEREAFAEVVATQLAYAECRAGARRQLGQGPPPPGECACGKHAAPAVKAQREREKALAGVDRAISKHKAGG